MAKRIARLTMVRTHILVFIILLPLYMSISVPLVLSLMAEAT